MNAIEPVIVIWLGFLFGMLITPRGRRTLARAVTDIGHVLGFVPRVAAPADRRKTLADEIADQYADGTLTLDGIGRFVEHLDQWGNIDKLDEPVNSSTNFYWNTFNATRSAVPPAHVSAADADRRLREAASSFAAPFAARSAPVLLSGAGGSIIGTASVCATAHAPTPPVIVHPNLEVVEVVGVNGEALAHVARAKRAALPSPSRGTVVPYE